MAVENILSTVITNVTAKPPVVPDGAIYVQTVLAARDTFTVTQTTGSVGSTYRLLRLPSSVRIRTINFLGDGTVALPGFSIGAASVDQVPATSSAATFGTGKAITASTAEVVVFGNTYSANAPIQLWQAAGFTSDPGGVIDLLVTITTANTAAGTIEAKITFAGK